MPSIKKLPSHKHKKFNRYTANPTARRKSKKSFGLWWLIPVCAFAAFIAALILGTVLGDQVTPAPDETPSAPEAEQTPPPAEPENIVGGKAIDACFVSLDGIEDNTAYEVSSQIPDGAAAVSLVLFDKNGAPYFKSDIAAANGKPCGELTLKNAFKPIVENDIYSSVIFPSFALTNTSELDRYIQNAYEYSLIRELVGAGTDEILIHCLPFGSSVRGLLLEESFTERFVEYITDIKRKFPSLRVGFTVSINDLTDPELSQIIEDVCKYADFCAADATSARDDDELSAALESASIPLLRHEMRVLLGGKNPDTLSAQYSVLDKLKLLSRQVVLPAAE